MSVYPSGFARAAYAIPTPPPAPARFSITKLCLRTLPRECTNGRPITSEIPPGEKGTTTVTGLDGYAS